MFALKVHFVVERFSILEILRFGESIFNLIASRSEVRAECERTIIHIANPSFLKLMQIERP